MITHWKPCYGRPGGGGGGAGGSGGAGGKATPGTTPKITTRGQREEKIRLSQLNRMRVTELLEIAKENKLRIPGAGMSLSRQKQSLIQDIRKAGLVVKDFDDQGNWLPGFGPLPK